MPSFTGLALLTSSFDALNGKFYLIEIKLLEFRKKND